MRISLHHLTLSHLAIHNTVGSWIKRKAGKRGRRKAARERDILLPEALSNTAKLQSTSHHDTVVTSREPFYLCSSSQWHSTATRFGVTVLEPRKHRATENHSKTIPLILRNHCTAHTLAHTLMFAVHRQPVFKGLFFYRNGVVLCYYTNFTKHTKTAHYTTYRPYSRIPELYTKLLLTLQTTPYNYIAFAYHHAAALGQYKWWRSMYQFSCLTLLH